MNGVSPFIADGSDASLPGPYPQMALYCTRAAARSQAARPGDARRLARVRLFHLDRAHARREVQRAQRLADVVRGGAQVHEHQGL